MLVPVITISQIIFIVYEDVGKLECKELPPDPKKNKYVKLKLLVTIHWNVIMLIPIDKLSNVLSTFGCACGVWKPSLNLCDCHHSLPCIVGGPLCGIKKKAHYVCEVRRKLSQQSLSLWNVNVVGNLPFESENCIVYKAFNCACRLTLFFYCFRLFWFLLLA